MYSNLGGLGPDYYNNASGVDVQTPPVIRFGGVGYTHKGDIIDVVVSNLTEYRPYITKWNKLDGQGFANINLDSNFDTSKGWNEVSLRYKRQKATPSTTIRPTTC